MDIVKKRLL